MFLYRRRTQTHRKLLYSSLGTVVSKKTVFLQNRKAEKELSKNTDLPEHVEKILWADKNRMNPHFDTILLEALDNALASLGESSKQAIYYSLKIRYNIETHEIPDKIEEVESALEKIFGLGSLPLKLLFMRFLYASVTMAYGVNVHSWFVSEMTFTDYVRVVKQKVEKLRELKVSRKFKVKSESRNPKQQP